jgi:hypothetical protein
LAGQLAANHPDDALQYLREAINRGYKDANGLITDPDLEKFRPNSKLPATRRRTQNASRVADPVQLAPHLNFGVADLPIPRLRDPDPSGRAPDPETSGAVPKLSHRRVGHPETQAQNLDFEGRGTRPALTSRLDSKF